MQDEPIERKRQKMCDDSFVIHEPVQTQNEVEMESSFSDQTSYDVQPSCSYSPPGPSFKDLEINMKQIQQITGSAHPIESQTFWNTNYKDDLDSSVFMNPLSVIQVNRIIRSCCNDLYVLGKKNSFQINLFFLELPVH